MGRSLSIFSWCGVVWD